jgi:hypothetical protein
VLSSNQNNNDMKGIYLTEEAEKEIQAKIAELEEDRQHWLNNTIKNIGNSNYNSLMDSINQAKAEQASYLLREILSSATILPVDNWENIKDMLDINTLPISYRNGVIIQPKQ